MRIRASIAAVTGTLALGGLLAPYAVAGETPRAERGERSGAFAKSGAGKSGASGKYGAAANPTVTKVVVNGGKPLVVGLADKAVRATFSVNAPGGIENLDAELWGGSVYGDTNPWVPVDGFKSCAGTAANCSADFLVMPAIDLNNKSGGGWNLALAVFDKQGGDYINEKAGKLTLLRHTKLTANAGPEPVKKGQNVTVDGLLTIVNWDRRTYTGYVNHTVQLEFLKKDTKTWTPVKTLKTDKNGKVKTTAKASVDGYWRLRYAGTGTVAPVTSTSDFVDVR
ncbi:calcium-binding protein [Streptomyces sp. NPDC020875]|uniref:calcium-binding protein n=1 Tax=Streptomyces sp. NPDC020875 TaxID=3154898 RepID=UPI0033D23785